MQSPAEAPKGTQQKPKVTPYGRLTFLVQSRTRPAQKWLVDLGWYNGNGRCECEDFRCRYPKRTCTPWRCYHIKIAREVYTDGKIAEDLKMEQP